jgi:predicted TIM-barrel fold metal-dependent hydrolase
MEIIDCHTHIIHPGETRNDSLWRTYEDHIAVLREAGISHALACGSSPAVAGSFEELVARNRRLAATCAASDGFFIPAAEIPQTLGGDACDLLRFCHDELGMCFISELYDYGEAEAWSTPDAERFFDCAVELRMVPLIRCLNAVSSEIGTRYPEGRFLVCDNYDTHRYDRYDAIVPYPCLFLDISCESSEVDFAVGALGSDRVVFGSDLGASNIGFVPPCHHHEIDPMIAVSAVQRSALSETDQAKIFAGNFRALWTWTQA